MTASDSRPASISGVEAIITATEAQMTPLCGESAGATTATASQIYVAAVNENAHGYPVFVQAGYVRARNEGDRQVFPAFSLEYKWGPTWDSGDSYRMAFRRCDITEPGTRKFEIYTCSTTPGCWIVRIEGLTHCDPESPTPDFVFTMWRPEFDGLLMDNARWYGELSNLEDRLCGSVANPCVFDQCKVRVNWGDTPVPAVIGQMGQECQTQRPEWGIAVPSPWKAEIWDLYPDQ